MRSVTAGASIAAMIFRLREEQQIHGPLTGEFKAVWDDIQM
jgi:hypothetical protein